jgi:hypothetical protein
MLSFPQAIRITALLAGAYLAAADWASDMPDYNDWNNNFDWESALADVESPSAEDFASSVAEITVRLISSHRLADVQ